MRVIFSTIILAMFAQPAWAQTVYYCVMTECPRISADGLERYQPERFKLSVDHKLVKFGNDRSLDGATLDVKHYFRTTSSFTAEAGSPLGAFSIANFKPPHFFFAGVFPDEVVSFHATFDKF